MSIDLISFIPGVGPTKVFSPGLNTPAPFNTTYTGATDGTGPTTATNMMAEIVNRVLLQIAGVIIGSGLTIDNTNWTQLLAAVNQCALNVANAGFVSTTAYAANFGALKAGNGYVHLGPTGMILEWGTFTSPGGGGYLTISPLPLTMVSAFGAIAVSANASTVLGLTGFTSNSIQVQNGGGQGYYFIIGSMS